MSDTPRTDEAAIDVNCCQVFEGEIKTWKGRYVALDFARTLQRELQRAQQDARRWIPVEEKSPDLYRRVLVSGGTWGPPDGHAHTQCAYVDGCLNFWADDRREGAAPIKPAHWMPLPDAPGQSPDAATTQMNELPAQMDKP